MRSVIISKALLRISPRWRVAVLAQPAWALSAASSAASASSGCPSATSQRLSPVAGSSTESVPPSLASRHSPPINSRLLTPSISACSDVCVLIHHGPSGRSSPYRLPLYTHAFLPQSVPRPTPGTIDLLMSAKRNRARGPREARRVLEEKACAKGFDLVGVTGAEPLTEGGERLKKWQEAGMAADMGYMHRPVALLSDPRRLQKSARSVVSLGVSYYPGEHPENLEGGGRVARYAWGKDYHLVIKERLRELRAELEEALGCRIKARAFTDAVPLLERSAAQHAGLGFFGRNSCLINGEIGSYFFIADLIVDLDLKPDPFGTGTCGRCSRCMDRCPTGAIKAPGVVDARLCISYLTIENRGEIPRELRGSVGDWAFRCDVCQEVCPYNKTKASRSRWPEFSAGAGRPAPQLLRGRRKSPDEAGGPRARTGPARGRFAARARARGVGARRDRG